MQDRHHPKKQKIVDLIRENSYGTCESGKLLTESINQDGHGSIQMQFHNSSITIGSVTVHQYPEAK